MHFAGSNKSNFICLFRCRKNYLSFLLVTHNINTMCTYCFRQNGMNCCASIGTVWQLEIAWFRHGFLDSIIGKDIVIILKFCYPVGNGDISMKLSIVSSIWFLKENTLSFYCYSALVFERIIEYPNISCNKGDVLHTSCLLW